MHFATGGMNKGYTKLRNTRKYVCDAEIRFDKDIDQCRWMCKEIMQTYTCRATDAANTSESDDKAMIKCLNLEAAASLPPSDSAVLI